MAGILSRRWFKVACQSISLLVINGHYNFFKTLTIYQGKLKSVCFPVLNCYSCPLALYSCPIGSLQYFIMTGGIPVYVTSSIAFVGVAFGRMTCGLLCPFGFLQDILFKRGKVRIPLPNFFRWFKYLVLLVIVILAAFYFAAPVFCKLCPAGTLEAGFPMAILDETVKARIFDPEIGWVSGWLFLLKTAILTLILLAALNIKRPFCRIFCPLGALFSLFNRFSILRINVDQKTCNHCEQCARICPVDLNISTDPDSPECIRCMKCTTCRSISPGMRLLPLPLGGEND